MKIRYNCKDYQPSEKLQAVIERKLTRLDRFFVNEPSALIVLRTVKNTSIIEITLTCDNTSIRCERNGSNFYDLIDECMEVVEKLIVKHKNKINKRVKFNDFEDEINEAEPDLVRIKNVDIKPMDINEAILQLELLGHDFYMFENSATGKMNTVYKRKDGNYAVIQPTN